ncbi:Ribosome biogenesis protein erb1 [Coemansia sp. RSA 1813]|nr:Ribosome biogenesis protein erb1 [Coemansia sp. RSA 1646]KAJ1773377.1 Ribosome biogenesis protein erb1 [Coemansia sp. RSA 1843]KAJ2091595.1 Ribosome biogenesis protein erb1 [Coemansia sp. RSA 986]KAJ2212382.1 Ribosome biogenesis protein erb1 [Coemansia sp. RSA 487]KAJ2572204.1 Ribosome biogenesis protein erb1 [Coemansia sp. RSA 1813]
MVVKSKGSKNKRSLATREKEVIDEAEEFPKTSGIDMPTDPEVSDNNDEDLEDIEEGDFDEVLKKMAADQGFSSGDEDLEDEDDDQDQGKAENDEDEDESNESDADDESDIRSSDIEGASSEEDEEDDDDEEEELRSDISDDDSIERNELLVKRASSRLTDGQDTAVESDHSNDNEDDEAEKLANEGFERLTIRDFGRDLEAWKEYRKTLPQIDAGYASDSSTEEPVNTIGNVPIEWYEDYPHIGYDVDGKRVMRPATSDELDKFLANMDDPDVFRTAKDETNQRDVKLSEEEIDIVRRIQGGSIPDANYNPYEDTVEWFTSQTMVTPLSSATPAKRGFIPSKWEHKRVMKIVQAIRQGRITRTGPANTEGPQFYDIWDKAEKSGEQIKRLEGSARRPRLPAPRQALPTHEESYHPPDEYLPTEKEKQEWLKADPEDRKRSFMPEDFGSLRLVPGYSQFIQERFQRCLDLYLAPRAQKKTSSLNPEELMPKLPDPRDLRPFPSVESLVYRGHTGRVRSISVDPTGLWILSGSDDGTVRLWELISGRCAGIWDLKEVVHMVAWNPNPDLCMFAAAAGSRVVIVVPASVCGDQKHLVSEEYVRAGFGTQAKDDDEVDDSSVKVSWDMPTSAEQAAGIRVCISMHMTAKSVAWHRRGDYLGTLASTSSASSVLIHQVSKHKSQHPFRRLKGVVQSIRFHPTRPWFLVTTQRYVRIYNLMQQALVKTLLPGVKWISSIDVHPQGDNVIVGSYDKKLSWFDLDLSAKPYKSIRYHTQAIRQVKFSHRFPLFATASDDGSIQVYHGMVYQDLNQNPLIVPLKILRGHEIRNSLGVLDCVFHPIQPWLLSSGADGTIRLWT